jgi:hypothetical protein
MRPITIELPDELYGLLQRRAASSQRTLQQELLGVITKAADDDRKAGHIEHVLADMEDYSDADLWSTAKAVLSQESCERSQELNDKQREEGLTPAERIELESLVTQYEWHVLLRSQAMGLLKQRGHDISPLLTPPPGSAA